MIRDSPYHGCIRQITALSICVSSPFPSIVYGFTQHTLMQLSYHEDIRIKKILMRTLACQPLCNSFRSHQENCHITFACQLLSIATLVQLLFYKLKNLIQPFHKLKNLIQPLLLNSHQLLSRFSTSEYFRAKRLFPFVLELSAETKWN